jgi:pyruvate dehydrogenase E2 component (dihydrolipoamide acetyltransferase)
MPFTLMMPKLSPTMEEGSITKWRKNVGDLVEAGDVLFEVATDKATVEHTALDGGFLRSVLVEIGEGVRVGQPVAVFTLSKEEDISSYQPEGLKPEVLPEVKVEETPEAKPVEKKEPRAASSMQQPLFTPEPPVENYKYPFPEGPLEGRIRVSPYAKKLAKDQGADLSTIKGSGPRGMIVSRDLASAQKGSKVFGSRAVPQVAPGSYEEEALSPMRKVIATRLQQSKSFIPHFYVTQHIDAEPMMKLREQLKSGGVKVTVNDIITRATALALKEHPVVNSGFNSETQSIIRFQTIDISIAVSVDAGLITPIVRYADYKNLGQIAVEVRLLAEKAKAGKLAREEYVGGSFTISNLGMYGVSEFKGIINPPQAAILCIGGVEDKVVLRNGMVHPGKSMTLSLSADHRVIDGSDAAKFIKTLQNLLENPALLLI